MSQRSIPILGNTISPQGQFIAYNDTTIISSSSAAKLFTINTITGATFFIVNSDICYLNNSGLPYNQPIAVHNNYLYMLNSTNPAYNGSVNCQISRVNMTNSTDASFNMMPSFPFKGIGVTFITPYIYHYHITNCAVYRIDLRSFPLTAVYMQTSPTITGANSLQFAHTVTCLTSNNIDTLYGFGYYSGQVNKNDAPPSIFKYNITANTLIHPFSSLPSTYNFYGGTSYWDIAYSCVYYNKTVYVPGQYAVGNVYAFKTEISTSGYTYFRQTTLINTGSTLLNGNIVGGSGSTLYFISLPPPPTYTPPFIPTITSAISNSASQLTVSLYDASNTAANEVTYLYSTTGTTYADTGVAYTGSTTTYNFTISKKESGLSLTDISFTLYVKAQNGGLVSGNATSANVIVYQTPTAPPTQLELSAVGPGNVQVIITETSPVPYYYLNNVSYYLYAYNTFGGNNLSGNTSLLVYNRPVGILSNTNSSYGNVVSYVNTGLTANTYTMYVIARNAFGNSNPISANIAVLVVPSAPSIDAGNTKSLTSGNLTISINDTVNNRNNQIYYLYSTDNITYGNSGVVNNGNTNYKFTVKDTGNAQIPLTANTYTLYVQASNTIGNATSTSYSVRVYTTPSAPSIDTGNTKSTSSGSLTVSLIDTQNSSTNGIYYLYSTDNITYGNSGVSTTAGNTIYTFPISNTGNSQIPLTAGTYTLYIKASNTIGNSTTTSSPVQVYTTPQTPLIDIGNTKSTTSGNLTVSIIDSSNNATNGIYYLYSTDNITYGNSGVAKTSGNTYTFPISNTGNAQIPLTANTYTLYIKASNTIGNSTTTSAPIIVYTTPQSPTIDATNTQSLTSGNLTVYVNDTVNSLTNGIYYLYSMDGITYGNSGAYKTGNTAVFTISNTGNAQLPLTAKTYTLYIAAANPVGNTVSTPATAIESVYVIPSPPTIDQTNTKSITSGNLNVGFTDASNNGNNQVEYTYFMYDSTAAPLFFV